MDDFAVEEVNWIHDFGLRIADFELPKIGDYSILVESKLNSMNVTVDKLDLIQQILLIKDEKMLEAIAQLIQTKRKSSDEVDGREELPTAVKDSIETSQKQVENGEGIPLSDVLAKYRKRYHV